MANGKGKKDEKTWGDKNMQKGQIRQEEKNKEKKVRNK